MEQSQWEIIILKPTFVFLSFLAAQLPDTDLPELRVLQSDTTAYAIRKQATEEATLDEIEKHFPMMFKHEIRRWLGDNIRNEIEGSFLDFLCCFKFELHSQIVVMEPSITQGHQLLCVKPRTVLFKWMKSSSVNEQEQEEDATSVLERVNLSHLADNATVVVKNFNQLSEVKPFIQHYYRPIFKAEMLRMMCGTTDQWPAVDSFQKFNRYFAVEFHTQLIHLH